MTDEVEGNRRTGLQTTDPPELVHSGVLWGLYEHVPTGELFLCDPGGGRFTFKPSEAAHIAAALADHCTDPDDREYVSDTWGELWDEEDDDDG